MNEHPDDHNKIDLQTPDESRPLKRVRLEAPLCITRDLQQEIMDGTEDGWSDVYSDKDGSAAIGESTSVDREQSTKPVGEDPTSIAPSAPGERQYGVAMQLTQETPADEAMNGVPADAIADEDKDDLVASPPRPPLGNDDKASIKVMEETTDVEYQPQLMTDFLAAAAAQKGDKRAEWEYDSSDAASTSSSDSDTSSDSSDDDDDSDSGSADGYELMDAATAAKMLMSEEGDDDDADKLRRKPVEYKPRTLNEQDETVVKPNINVGPDDKITLLGTVETIVENMILINGAISGEYQALEPGSAVCNEEREVIGTVTDTLGQVREPKYIVAFNSRQEIEDLGLLDGIKIFYINKASTFVFTAPLRTLKGTDASNIHDEEIGENEHEFSDDEEEAEYKRLKKAAKKSGKSGLSRSEFQIRQRTLDAPSRDGGDDYGNARDAPHQSYGGGLSYDDDDGSADEFYRPLQRPENLPHLMGSGTLPQRPPKSAYDRGSGRSRGNRGGRGQGDRGRGRGRSDQRGGRSDRGALSEDRRPSSFHRGSAQSLPNRHTGHEHGVGQLSAAFAALPAQPYQPSNLEPYRQQSYQFNGQTYQYGYPPSPGVYNHNPHEQQNPAGQYSTGTMYGQSAYYQGQQQQTYGSYPPAPTSSVPQQSPSAQVPPPNIDISSILSRLGAQRPPPN